VNHLAHELGRVRSTVAADHRVQLNSAIPKDT
jgi:hypothetical protein